LFSGCRRAIRNRELIGNAARLTDADLRIRRDSAGYRGELR